jgi:hypothetical protein
MARTIRKAGVNDPRFLQRIERARNSLQAGRGVRLEDIEPE